MPATVVVGLQWGDEGKGKTTDLLAGRSVVRGALPGRRQRRPHHRARRRGLQAPPGARAACFDPHITPVIGNGVVVNPARLIDEMAHARRRAAWTCRRLRVSSAAHVIMPYHVALDAAAGGATARAASWAPPTAASARPTPTGRCASALRMGDLLDRGPRARPPRAQPAARPTPSCAGRSARRRLRARAAAWRSRRAGASGWRPTSSTRRPCSRPPSRPASTSCWRAPRARCWTWTTARTPT